MSSVPQAIIAEAQRQGVDPSLALEVAIKESGLNPNIPDSKAGAIGLFQLMPATAAGLGVDPRDAQQNIQGGITYLRQLLAKYGDPALALGAYDWGPEHVDNAVATYGSNWLLHAPVETQNYVTGILSALQISYSSTFADSSAPATASVAPAASADLSQLKIAFAVFAVIIAIGFVIGSQDA